MDIEVIGQLVNSMEESVNKLEVAVASNNILEINKLRVFIFDLHNKISDLLGGVNV